MIPEVVFVPFNQFYKRNQQAPGVRAIHYQSLQQNLRTDNNNNNKLVEHTASYTGYTGYKNTVGNREICSYNEYFSIQRSRIRFLIPVSTVLYLYELKRTILNSENKLNMIDTHPSYLFLYNLSLRAQEQCQQDNREIVCVGVGVPQLVRDRIKQEVPPLGINL